MIVNHLGYCLHIGDNGITFKIFLLVQSELTTNGIISIKDALTHKELTILIMVSNNAVAESSPIFLLLLAGQCLQMQSI